MNTINPRALQLQFFAMETSSQLSQVESIADLLSVAAGLAAKSGHPFDQAALQSLAATSGSVADAILEFATEIDAGNDPLGDTFCRILSPDERRPAGATYTPGAIVDAMLDWSVAHHPAPARIVDAGAGSGRFLVAAGRRYPKAHLVGVELDPVAVALSRAHLSTAGFGDRSEIVTADFRSIKLPHIDGTTLFIGNPPYVRHHLISDEWKTWLVDVAKKYGHAASKLAGLHIHFFLAVLEAAQPGDAGIFVTAAEWLDVNYGRLLRELLLAKLGGVNIQVIEPTAEPFPGTATTAAITAFEIGATPTTVGFRRVAALGDLGALPTEYEATRAELKAATRWTPLTRVKVPKREGFVELGELMRVHRGQVTGANHVWIQGEHSRNLPTSVLYPTVTRARELIEAERLSLDASTLKCVIDLPIDLDELGPDERVRVEAFLAIAKKLGADSGFIARHRKAWWSVGLRAPAPILATYMARRPPAFVLNAGNARNINVAHGLYPREAMPMPVIAELIEYLSEAVSTHSGRTYAGGLTKFEPREMERLMVPSIQMLESGEWRGVS